MEHNNIQTNLKSIRFGQVNLQRSSTAGNELRVVSQELKLDVLLLQEPYALVGKVRGMGLRTKVLGNQPAGTERPWSAIAVTKETITPLELLQFKTSYFTTAQIDTEIGKIYCISSYFRFSHRIEPYLVQLDQILHSLRGNHVIIGLDANAKSASWHSRETDDRGEALQGLIDAHGLVVINTAEQPHTHVNPGWAQEGRGETNIDVTLATQDMSSRITEWKVHEDLVLSDHRLITWTVSLERERTSEKSRNYAIQRANWPLVTHITNIRLEAYGVQSNSVERSTEEIAETFSKCVKEGCDGGIPKRKIVQRAVPWWNNELAAARRRLKTARKRFQRCCPCDQKAEYEQLYRRTRAVYKAKIKNCKERSWKEFVADEGNRNPWGLVYKLGADKLKISEVLTSLRIGNTPNTWTMSIEETLGLLLDSLMPPDTPGNEGQAHNVIRERAKSAGVGEELPFTMYELTKAIKLMKPRKSPGPDCVPAEVVRNWDERTKSAYLRVANRCWETGIFPRCWKKSQIKIIRKAGERDWSDPTNYRPISLLPVMGKLLERLIAMRLQNGLSNNILSDRQYGFVPGRSTVDAVQRAMEFIQQSRNKYVVGLFIDIKGAFDGVWWPGVIEKLVRLQLSKNIVSIIRSYLSDRQVALEAGSSSVTRVVSKGCPQGSVLGPYLWNLVFDDFLQLAFPEGTEVIAYADDGLVLVRADSRNEIEQKFQLITSQMESWATLVKLQFAVNKTKLIMFKSKLRGNHQPVVTLQGERVEFVQKITYLGLVIDEGLTFISHAKQVGDKAKKLFGKIIRLARFRFGITPKTLSTIYEGVFVPIMTYGSRVWAHRSEKCFIKRSLRSTQRTVLMGVTGAYRTTSFSAIVVAAGKIPIDLLVQEGPMLWESKKGRIQISKEEIRRRTLLKWQEEWDQSTTGRLTYTLLPSIEERLGLTWLQPNHTTMQYLTGHGAFCSYLNRFGHLEEPTCPCGEAVDGPDHVTFECIDLEDERQALIRTVQEEAHEIWPCAGAALLRNTQVYQEWRNFIRIANEKRNV